MEVALVISGPRLADTFNVVNTLPNVVYELILGGVLTSVFIPLLVDALRHDAKCCVPARSHRGMR